MNIGKRMDLVMETLGPRGKYQMLQMMVSLSPSLPAAIQLLSNVFTCRSVDHRCAAPPNNSDFFNRYHDNANYTYEQCSIVVRLNGTILAEESCLFGMDYMGQRKDMSAMSEFDLVCDRAHLAKLSQSLVIVGQGIGAVLTSIVSERFGRKFVLIAANLGLLVCGLTIAYSPHVIVFMIFKFVVGCFQQGVLTGKYTFCAELFPTKHRHLNAVFASLAWAIAVMLLPFLSWLCKDFSWRTLQAVYCTTNATVLLQFLFMDESLRWLLANGKSEQAAKVLARASKMNGVPLEKVMMVYNSDDQDETNSKLMNTPETQETNIEIVAKSEKKMNLLDIFRIRRLLINAMAIWFAWFTTALSFFAIYLTSLSLAGDPYINFFLIATMEVPRAALFYFFQGRAGRKITTGIVFCLVAVGLLTRGIVQSFDPSAVSDIVIMIATMVGMAGSSGCFGAVFSYTPELFPTNIRNQSLGLASFMGRIGGMLAPFTADLAALVKWGPGVLIGLCAVGVCLLLTILPETAGKELPQTMEELQAWYNKPDKNKVTEEGGDQEKQLMVLDEKMNGKWSAGE